MRTVRLPPLSVATSRLVAVRPPATGAKVTVRSSMDRGGITVPTVRGWSETTPPAGALTEVTVMGWSPGLRRVSTAVARDPAGVTGNAIEAGASSAGGRGGPTSTWATA